MTEDERRRYRMLRGAYAYMGSSPSGNKIGSASGSIATFDTNLAAPLISLVLNIEPHQEGSGDPSPENIRPITGYTGVNIYVSPTGQIGDAVVYPISFSSDAGTVYGGTLDVKTGVLTVDMVKGNLYGAGVYSAVRESNLWRLYLTVFDDRFAGANMPYTISDKYIYVQEYTSIQQINNSYGFSSFVTQMFIHDDTFTNVTDIRNKLDSSPLEIVYTLATPITYQLTPTEVRTLIGTNNIFMDADGTVNLEYQYRS